MAVPLGNIELQRHWPLRAADAIDDGVAPESVDRLAVDLEQLRTDRHAAIRCEGVTLDRRDKDAPIRRKDEVEAEHALGERHVHHGRGAGVGHVEANLKGSEADEISAATAERPRPSAGSSFTSITTAPTGTP